MLLTQTRGPLLARISTTSFHKKRMEGRSRGIEIYSNLGQPSATNDDYNENEALSHCLPFLILLSEFAFFRTGRADGARRRSEILFEHDDDA